MVEKQYCIYIMMNERNTVIYIGITSNLPGRIWQHKQKLVDGFTKQYNITKLVYYEVFVTAYDAITREKQLKRWRREKKLWLIQEENPTLKDLYETL